MHIKSYKRVDYARATGTGVTIQGNVRRSILSALLSVSALSRCISVAVLLLAGCGRSPAPVPGTLIINAEVYDGSGGAASSVAVRIDGDRITEVGELTPLKGEKVVDASNLVLAHGTIRAAVMKHDYRRHADDEEIAEMAALVEADMQAGAVGLATGLEYEPGIFSETSEIVALAKVAARYGGTYSTHMRDEDDRMPEAIDEVIEISLNADIPANISHIKLADMEFWHTADAVIAKLDAARADGADITADIYPYLRWQANLRVLFPERDYADRAVAEYTFAHSATPENILIVEFLPNPALNDMTIAEIAATQERDPVDVLLDLSAEADRYRRDNGRDGASIIAKGMHDDDVTRFMQWPHTAICSDGSHESGHPRGHGAFPRVLGRYVRELGVLSLADAVHKMTGLTAKTLRLPGRGRIEPGAFADLVLFDATAIADTATMSEPAKLSLGVEKVWVNGVLVFDDGRPTLEFPGQIVTL